MLAQQRANINTATLTSPTGRIRSIPLIRQSTSGRAGVPAAWSYINPKDNAAKYDPDEVAIIKERIKKAAKKHDVEISAD